MIDNLENEMENNDMNISDTNAAGKAEEQHEEENEAKNKKNKHSSKKKLSKEEKLEEKINELEVNLAELNDKYLRLFSEFDNYRKRTNKERIELLDTASVGLITELLPVLDNFERALKAMETGTEEQKSNIDGVNLIFNQLKAILTKKGLEPMKSVGETFDTDFHEALTNIPAPTGDLKGKVIDEIEKGYMLKGKVIRFARVVVGQ